MKRIHFHDSICISANSSSEDAAAQQLSGWNAQWPGRDPSNPAGIWFLILKCICTAAKACVARRMGRNVCAQSSPACHWGLLQQGLCMRSCACWTTQRTLHTRTGTRSWRSAQSTTSRCQSEMDCGLAALQASASSHIAPIRQYHTMQCDIAFSVTYARALSCRSACEAQST